MPKQSDGAKKLIGDFSPKLVELTDRVLFDDVWERRELSKHDRSLIRVAATHRLKPTRPIAVPLWESRGEWSQTRRID